MMEVQMFGGSGSLSNCRYFTLASEGLPKRPLSYNSGAKSMKELKMTSSVFTSSFPQRLHKKAETFKVGHCVHKVSGSLMLSLETSVGQTPAIGLIHHSKP